MKRLLAAHGEAIYQIGKVFRVDPVARYHNPEFTLLEWYQPGYGLAALIDEVEALVLTVLGGAAIPRFSYAEVFQQHLGIDPHRVSPSELNRAFRQHVDSHSAELTATDQLQLLLDQLIIPDLPDRFFLTEYPEAQAALARTRQDDQGNRLAQRFELFCQGVEIANGYEELRDPAEQQRRFSADQQTRVLLSKPVYPVDERLLAALHSGLPACSGVALGVDRLLMLKLGAERIEDVLSFDASRA
jgi:lysyl-tRNA synthetase class 2